MPRITSILLPSSNGAVQKKKEQSRVRVIAVALKVARKRHGPAAAAATAHDILSRAPIAVLGALIALKLSPSLHGDLAAVEFALGLHAALLGLVPGRLARIAPRKVVKDHE